MTRQERRMVFVYSEMCRISDDLNHVLKLLRDHDGSALIDREPEIRRSVSEAHTSAEKAHDLLEFMVGKRTDYKDESDAPRETKEDK